MATNNDRLDDGIDYHKRLIAALRKHYGRCGFSELPEDKLVYEEELQVHSPSGSTYTINPDGGFCECKRDGLCSHLLFAQYVRHIQNRELTDLDPEMEPDDAGVSDDLAEAAAVLADGEPPETLTDGGPMFADSGDAEVETVDKDTDEIIEENQRMQTGADLLGGGDE
jgi:hypothetical protein